MDAVTLKLSCRAYQFSQKLDRAAHRCVLAGELTDVIVSTTSEQTSAFCLAPDLINESDPWQFGACQCSRGVCVANTHS